MTIKGEGEHKQGDKTFTWTIDRLYKAVADFNKKEFVPRVPNITANMTMQQIMAETQAAAGKTFPRWSPASNDRKNMFRDLEVVVNDRLQTLTQGSGESGSYMNTRNLKEWKSPGAELTFNSGNLEIYFDDADEVSRASTTSVFRLRPAASWSG